ncbi:hypothetical protein ABIF65_008669 [Bradyrhizobium japonicum]|jgi:hypothetical protein|nr:MULTISPECIES: hypothetical protein [Bradyrhizobium]MBR0879952.1 hypothetical protein [Bradyrhizobium liaoningense]MBR0947537.1 hypothetical protein [Bradyrhizobium liaoningense]MBR1002114.1 hypothetical protein [Bradyrhizobium liaoningense]MBR1027954.1 hypothetical protein [Bradyrhizobium liaoningense]MBR1065925.1 hypothetical protein [Bradyrhizobium liaoningense]
MIVGVWGKVAASAREGRLFDHPTTLFAQLRQVALVARMERSEIRDRFIR